MEVMKAFRWPRPIVIGFANTVRGRYRRMEIPHEDCEAFGAVPERPEVDTSSPDIVIVRGIWKCETCGRQGKWAANMDDSGDASWHPGEAIECGFANCW